MDFDKVGNDVLDGAGRVDHSLAVEGCGRWIG
jgi:hypothetical protein